MDCGEPASAREVKNFAEVLDPLFGTYAKYEFLSMAAAAAVGGFVPRVDSRFFWWAGAAGLLALAGASSWLLSGLPRPEPPAREEDQSDLMQVFEYLRRQPADLALLFAVILALNLYYQIVIQYWQPILAGAGMAPRASFFSAAFIGILLVQSAAGAAAARPGRRLRGCSPFWLALAASGLAVFGGVWPADTLGLGGRKRDAGPHSPADLLHLAQPPTGFSLGSKHLPSGYVKLFLG